jgi:hypothetical protein
MDMQQDLLREATRTAISLQTGQPFPKTANFESNENKLYTIREQIYAARRKVALTEPT